MSDPKVPPPLPPQTLEYRRPIPQVEQQYTDYDRAVDTVGMVPNLRAKDNLYQFFAGAIGAAVLGLVGGLATIAKGGPFIMGALGGGVGGFIIGVLLFGIALGIMGFFRGRGTRK